MGNFLTSHFIRNLVRCKDKLTTFHLFDALYTLLFLCDRCSNLIRAVCEYWCPETNTFYTSKGKVSLSIFDIYSFLGLPLLEHLCDEVVPMQCELTNKLPLSCTYLFTAYQKLMQGRKGQADHRTIDCLLVSMTQQVPYF